MLSITFMQKPTLSSVSRSESVTHDGQVLSAGFTSVMSSDGEALGAIVGSDRVWATALSGSVRPAAASGPAEMRVTVDGLTVVTEEITAGGLSFSVRGLAAKRSHSVLVQARETAAGARLVGTTTLSVTATDWGTDVVKDPEGHEAGDDLGE